MIARSWSDQICVNTGCCCPKLTFWVTFTLASIYLLKCSSQSHSEGTKEKHTCLQLAYILLKSDTETFHLMHEGNVFSRNKCSQLCNKITYYECNTDSYCTTQKSSFSSCYLQFILSLKDDGGANSCSVSHIPTLLGPQEFITFFTRKWEDGHLEFIQHQTRCAAVTV